jgi:[ribosomal protein S5]-alanine N-acetyltransferase
MIYELGKDYFVRPLAEADVDGPYPGWFEDQDVCRYNSHGKFFKTREHFLAYVRDGNREDRLVWAMCHADDGHIGNISLQGISWIDRTAEYAIILGDKRHWGRGVGLLASRAILAHGFFKLNLERIYCGAAATNTAMNKLAVAMGMTLEGRRRRHLFLHGERVDVVEYGILREEFAAERP